ncbi:MAG TPA: type II toxin-antitoxin system VapC family toxin [Vicinamibacteria bacterium]
MLDASAAVELLLNSSAGRRVAARLRNPRATLHAPHLIDLEVAQTLRRYVREGTLAEERGRLAVQHLALLDLERYPHDPFLGRIWTLRDNVTAYDAAYVALAEALSAPLVTCDRRLAESPGLGVDFELVG